MSKGRNEKGHFAEGNQISVGNEGGRPLKFPNPKELETFCKGYFKWADENPWIKNDFIKGGENAGMPIEIKLQRPYTLTALCLHLNIGLDTWREYEKRAEFSAVTTHARQKIENQQIEGSLVGLFNSNLTARLQGLVDKKETEIKGLNIPKMPDIGKRK